MLRPNDVPRRLDTAIPGLQLVPLADGDAEELFALTAANRAHLQRWLPWVNDVRCVADSSMHVRNGLELRRLGLRLDYTIRLHGRVIGTIAYHVLQPANRLGMIGYWLAQDATGHGYMTTAVRHLVEYGFVDLALNRIELRVAVGNCASQKICTRLGFKEEGVLREAEWLHDHFVDLRVNALLRSEWERGTGRVPGQMPQMPQAENATNGRGENHTAPRRNTASHGGKIKSSAEHAEQRRKEKTSTDYTD